MTQHRTAVPTEAVWDHIRAAVTPPDDPAAPLYRWLGYHLGWRDRDGRPTEARRGKGVRPLVSLLACAGVGADPTVAVPVAAAIEMTHAFSLVHDDLEDGDRVRRGRPTLWTVIGAAQAINAGDALFTLARKQITLAGLSDTLAMALLRRYDAACLALAEGQYLDIAFETADDVALDAYRTMIERKTGALLAAAAATGALAGGADEPMADRLADYGRALGAAFQIQDDALGLWGDPARTGKPAGNDLLRGKRSYPLLLALDDPDLGSELAALVHDPSPDPTAVRALVERLEAAGYRERTVAAARAEADAARAALAGLDLAAGPRAELEALVDRVVDRDR